MRRVHCLALAAGLLAAVPLPAQLPADSTEEARWIAEAARLEDADPAASLALVRRALPRLARPGAAPLRMRALVLGCWASAGAAPDSLLPFAARALPDAVRQGDARAVAKLRACRGYGLEWSGEPTRAMEDYEFAVAEGRRLGDAELLAGALLLRGQLHYYRGDFTTALTDLNEAHRHFTRAGRAGQQRTALNAIANVSADPRVAQYGRALEYYRQVLASNQAAGSQRGIATTLFNIGSTLERMDRLEEALQHYRRGLQMDLQRGDSAEVAVDRRAVGVALSKLGRPAEALALFDQTLAYVERRGDRELTAQTRLSRGVALRMLGRPAEALADLERARARFQATDNPRFLEKVHEERALALAAGGAWHEAYRARTEQIAVQRRLADAARQEQTSRLRVQFDSEKKERENRALTRENALRGQALAAAARVRRLQLAVLVLGAGIIGALILLVVRQVAGARRLREAALTDELTRLPNRRHLYLLANGVARGARSRGAGFAVLALDVDHFKRINDTFGHETGDAVLRRVADAARRAVRGGDHLGRVGGEEFVAVLPGASAAEAAQVAERVRAAVEALAFADLSPALRATVSVGLAAWEPADDGFADTLRRADDSLYRAKAAGRNRVEGAAARAPAPPPVAGDAVLDAPRPPR